MLQTYKPISPLLQNLIEFFYVFDSERPKNISYIAFPHVNTAISFFKGAYIERSNYLINIAAHDPYRNQCAVEILGKYTRPVFVNYRGYCEEIAIVFKPLGVNHFFANDLIAVAPHYSQKLENSLWTDFAEMLFGANNLDKKLEMLETFLVKNYRDLENKSLYVAIRYLEDTETNYSIEKIASLCGFSLKTFQRHFSKHLTCSPMEYKRIARFRHSLQNKLISKELKTLTSLSYESNYYDQSYFIREFKKLTQLNPGSFFDSITALEEKNIVWKVI